MLCDERLSVIEIYFIQKVYTIDMITEVICIMVRPLSPVSKLTGNIIK